jgi:hypothetical protein
VVLRISAPGVDARSISNKLANRWWRTYADVLIMVGPVSMSAAYPTAL